MTTIAHGDDPHHHHDISLRGAMTTLVARIAVNDSNCGMRCKLKIFLGVLLLLAATEWTPTDQDMSQQHKQPCIGYSILEYGKAIDCHGDTIPLTRKNGLQLYIVESNREKR